MSCRVVLCHVVLCRVGSVVSYCVVSCCIVLCRVVSCRAVPCRVVSCRVVRYGLPLQESENVLTGLMMGTLRFDTNTVWGFRKQVFFLGFFFELSQANLQS